MRGGNFMTQDKKILDFAMKYYYLYLNPQTTEGEVTNGFAEACRDLGFSPEGNPFVDLRDERESTGIHLPEETINHIMDDMIHPQQLLINWTIIRGNIVRNDNVLNNIDDPCTLGSLIFSRWKYIIRHASAGGAMNLLSLKNRKWFIHVFSILGNMVSEAYKSPFTFHRPLQSFHLRSRRMNTGQSFGPKDDVEQIFSVDKDGTIWLEHYHLVSWKLELTEKVKIPADPETAKKIIDWIDQYCSLLRLLNPIVEDTGIWDLTLMSQDGTQVRAFGKLVQDSAFYRGTYDLHHLSFMIRQALGRKDLLLFDGNPDYIERIEISYELHRDQEIPRYDRKKGHYFIDGNAQERLIIDRKSGTLEHFHQLSKKWDMDIHNTYHLPTAVAMFLNRLNPDIFSKVEGNPSDVITNPRRTDTYTIRITNGYAGTRELQGTFDKKGLPVDWPNFAKEVRKLFGYFGRGHILDPNNYGRTLRRPEDLIFCYVTLTKSGKRYYYLADKEYQPGEEVLVPVDSTNIAKQIQKATVKRTIFCPPENAPYPIEKIKKIYIPKGLT